MPTPVQVFESALSHHRAGNLVRAEELYREFVQLNPAEAQAHYLLAATLQQQGKLKDALHFYEQAIRLKPSLEEAHFNQGIVYKDLGQLAAAASCYRQALSLNPRSVDALNNLGVVLKNLRQPSEAVECYRKALQINPNHAPALGNLGNALKDQGLIEEAVASFRQAVRSNPNHVGTHNNLGIAFMVWGHFQEAMDQFEQALALEPENGTARWNRSLLRLLQGDFAKGWPEYEYRWTQPGFSARGGDRPRWDGSSFAGKTLLIYAEQGLGDTIQFARYIPMVKSRGGTVLFECQPALAPVLTEFAGVDKLIPAGYPLPPCDLQAPLLSLAGIFHTTLETIPAGVPYLRAHPTAVNHWRKVLEPLGGFKVGIVWRGSDAFKGDHYRSVPLARFEPLAKVAGVRLVSLQVGSGSEELGKVSFEILDLGSRFAPGSLEDLAAVLMSLDLIVTVDTAAAHLAGALGVPVWLALPLVPDWRWLLQRSDSPWYPTMRLFRQSWFGDWTDVFNRIRQALSSEL